MSTGNLLNPLPQVLDDEVFDQIVAGPGVRIERIVSRGHTSPPSGWYDQEQHEWVVVLRGHAIIELLEGRVLELRAGDYIEIPAHTRHRVKWTDPDCDTVWLAVHYAAPPAVPHQAKSKNTRPAGHG